MHHYTLEEKLKELENELVNKTNAIDNDNKRKEYLTKSIKDLTAKKSEIDTLVGEYEKAFDAFSDKKSTFENYVSIKKQMIEGKLGQQKKGKIDTIIEAETKKVEPTRNVLTNLKETQLPGAKTTIMNEQSNLTLKQAFFEYNKNWLKDYQNKFKDKLSQLEGLRKSADEDINKSELEDSYFFITELETSLKERFNEPYEFRSDLESKWKDIFDAMENFNSAENTLRDTQSQIETTQKKLNELEATRIDEILKEIGCLGTCDTD